jgi:four helix bundle protein
MMNVEVKNFCGSVSILSKEYRMLKEPRLFDIEDRLIEFSVRIIRLAEALPKTRTGNHIAGQIIRSGTSPAPNYGEAQGAESRSDFVHKMQICLKELRETRVWLLMIAKANLVKSASQLDPLIDENNQLISIFATSVKTVRQKGRDNS